MMRESGKLSVLTMASRILGLVREATRARLLGTAALGEAFTIAFSAPNLFRRLLAEGSMAAALIPTMKGYFAEGDEARTESFLSATYTALVIVVGAVVALGMAGAGPITGLYTAFRLDPSVTVDVAETALLMRFMFPFLALVSVAAFLQGILNSHGVFGPSGMAPVLFNVCFIVVPPLFGRYFGNPARAMAAGVLVGGLMQALWQLPMVIKVGARFRLVSPRKAFTDPGMRRVMRLIAPTIVGMAAYELNSFVSTALAAGVGAATSVQMSLRLQELVLGVFVVSIGTVLLPELSGHAAAADWPRYAASLVRSLETVLLVTVPVGVLSIVERYDIVAVVYGRGAFGEDSIRMTAQAFLFHSLGLACIGVNRIMAPAFYARKDSKRPTWAGMAAFGVNIVAAIVLSPLMGGSGIALALTLASVVNAAILVVMLVRMRIEGLGRSLGSAGLYAIRLLAFSAAAAVPALLARNLVASLTAASASRLVSAGLPFLAASLAFGAAGVLLLVMSKDQVAADLVASFKRRGSKRKPPEGGDGAGTTGSDAAIEVDPLGPDIE